MLIAISDYLQSPEAMQPYRVGHEAFLKKYFATRQFILSAQRKPAHLGGVILALVDSKESFEAILAEDPFVQHDCVRYQITEFDPVCFDDTLKPLLG